MVLFKFFVATYINLVEEFTFHYGPIQIELIDLFKTGVSSFTFHYGPIQIHIFMSW